MMFRTVYKFQGHNSETILNHTSTYKETDQGGPTSLSLLYLDFFTSLALVQDLSFTENNRYFLEIIETSGLNLC